MCDVHAGATWHPAKPGSLQIVSTEELPMVSLHSESTGDISGIFFSGSLCSQWFKSQPAKFELFPKVAEGFLFVFPPVRTGPGPRCSYRVGHVCHNWAFHHSMTVL